MTRSGETGAEHAVFLRLEEAVAEFGNTAETLRRRLRERPMTLYIDPTDNRRQLVRTNDLEALRQPRPARADSVAA